MYIGLHVQDSRKARTRRERLHEVVEVGLAKAEDGGVALLVAHGVLPADQEADHLSFRLIVVSLHIYMYVLVNTHLQTRTHLVVCLGRDGLGDAVTVGGDEVPRLPPQDDALRGDHTDGGGGGGGGGGVGQLKLHGHALVDKPCPTYYRVQDVLSWLVGGSASFLYVKVLTPAVLRKARLQHHAVVVAACQRCIGYIWR